MHAFRSVVEAREFDRLGEVFAEHVVLHSPIARKPYEGREMVVKIANGLDEITVMLRPLKAVQAFEEKMRVRFAAAIGDHVA